jgi:hypothetical protein
MDVFIMILGVLVCMGCAGAWASEEMFGGFLLLIMGISLITASSILIHQSGYKQGQVDSFNNIIKYKLIEKPDKTKEWDYISK